MMNIDLPRPFFVLAPMDDVTDSVFRSVVAETARPDLFFTEFVNVDGLQSPGRPKLLKKLQHTSEEQPLIAQIWGLKPENFFETAKQIVNGEFGTFAGIDLNMGCPEKNVVRNGACSALIQNRDLAREIIEATIRGANGKLPVSVKTRLGLSVIDLTWHEFLFGFKLDMLTIHGRTQKEMSKVPNHWDEIGKVRELRDRLAPQTLLVGNGDVMSRQQGIELAAQYKLDGIMIGRGIFHDPFIFADESPWETYTKEQRMALYQTHVKRFAETWKNNERPTHTLNKFCKIYINGFDGAKELREELMQSQTPEELLRILQA